MKKWVWGGEEKVEVEETAREKKEKAASTKQGIKSTQIFAGATSLDLLGVLGTLVNVKGPLKMQFGVLPLLVTDTMAVPSKTWLKTAIFGCKQSQSHSSSSGNVTSRRELIIHCAFAENFR